MDTLVDIAKVLAIVLPGVWFISEKFKGLSGKIDVLETRLEGKIDSRVSLLDQKIESKVSMIELQIKQYTESDTNNKTRFERVESGLRKLNRKLTELEINSKKDE